MGPSSPSPVSFAVTPAGSRSIPSPLLSCMALAEIRTRSVVVPASRTPGPLLNAISFPVILVLADPPSTWTPNDPFPMAAPVAETPIRLFSMRVRRAPLRWLLTRMPPGSTSR